MMEGGEVSSSFLEHVQCITHALSVPHQAKDKVKACCGRRSMHAFCLELTVSPHGSPKQAVQVHESSMWAFPVHRFLTRVLTACGSVRSMQGCICAVPYSAASLHPVKGYTRQTRLWASADAYANAGQYLLLPGGAVQ